MSTVDVGWRKLVSLVSQQCLDVAKLKEAVSEAFDHYPSSRPALLDLFSDFIVDKYVPSYIHQRNSAANELEEVISVLMKEINEILDKEFDCPDYVSTALKSKPSHYSGFGFNNYVCQWVLIVLLKITVKYEQVLSINDNAPPKDKIRWNQVPVIMGLLDILCKTINSKIVGHEVVSSIMRHVAQNRNHLLWVVKYIGERHPSGIVDKVIDCILSEFIPHQEYGKLQSCMNILSNLGAHHARQLQASMYDKLKSAIEESSDTVSQHKFTNYQTLIYFTLLLASRSDLFELTNAALSMVGRIISQFNPKQLEQFFLSQTFTENIVRSYYHMTLHILLNSLDLEIGGVLEFLVQHSHTEVTSKSLVPCCSPTFSNMCVNVTDNVCNKLFMQSHSSSVTQSKGTHVTMSLGVLNSVFKRIDFWTEKVVKYGSSVAAKLISCIVLNDFKTVGEDVLVAILTYVATSPQEVAGHMTAMVLFFRLLDECELINRDILNQVLVRSLCVAQSFKLQQQRKFLSTLLSMIVYESRVQTQRRRLTRSLSDNVDLLLLMTVTHKSLVTVRITVSILHKIDGISHGRCSSSTVSSLRRNSKPRFKAWPIFLSGRVVRCVCIMYSMLIDTIGSHNGVHVTSLRYLVDFLVNYLRGTDPRHTAVAIQVIFREYLRSARIETNNQNFFKKSLKPGWFGTKLVHDTPPVSSNTGQLQVLRRLNSDESKYSQVQELHWESLIIGLCHSHRSYEPSSTTSYQVIHSVIRQTLSPSYYLPVNPDVKVILKDLNSITTLWRRFNKVNMFWRLFKMLSKCAPDTLSCPSHQTLEALMIACQHLWSTSDCPKRRLLRKIQDTEIFVTCTKDHLIIDKNKYYELIRCDSDLYRSTVSLLECLSHKMVLAEELKLLLPYLSSTEVHTLLTHLLFNWNKLLKKPIKEDSTKDIRVTEQDIEDVTMTDQVEQQTALKDTFSWDTLLPSLVHSRVHFTALYDQFFRLLFLPLDY